MKESTFVVNTLGIRALWRVQKSVDQTGVHGLVPRTELGAHFHHTGVGAHFHHIGVGVHFHHTGVGVHFHHTGMGDRLNRMVGARVHRSGWQPSAMRPTSQLSCAGNTCRMQTQRAPRRLRWKPPRPPTPTICTSRT